MEWEDVFDFADLCPAIASRTPYAVTRALCKLDGDDPILVPNTSANYNFVEFTRLTRYAYTIRFHQWEYDEVSGILRITPLNKWRLDELFRVYPIVYFHDTTRTVRRLSYEYQSRGELASAKLDALVGKCDAEIEGDYFAQREVIDDMVQQMIARADTRFWLRVPRSVVFDVADDEGAVAEERERPETRLMSTDACDMIQPEYATCTTMPFMRNATPALRFFRNENKMENGVTMRRADGKPVVQKKAKAFAEEFAYKFGMPIYSYDLNEKAAKSYFCATDETIRRIYADRTTFKKMYANVFKDGRQADCISEVLMWRWGCKLFADLEAYYNHNQQVVGNEDDWTWRSIDFLNQQLEAICGIAGVTRESWTILRADSRTEKDGKSVGKVSRHGICQDPRVFFRTMMDVSIFYEGAKTVLEERIAAGDPALTFMDVLNEEGTTRKTFWDTGIVTFFRCFRMLGSDKFGKNRPLVYHAGARPADFEMACLIQHPFGGKFEDIGKYICFRVDGKDTVGALKFEYNEEAKLIRIFQMKGGKRKANDVGKISVQRRKPNTTTSTVPLEVEQVTMEWLRNSEIGKPWKERGSLDRVTMKRLQPFMYLIELQKVNCYCYHLAAKNPTAAQPVHNSGAVSLYIINTNYGFAKIKQRCQTSGKCPSDKYDLGRVPANVYDVLFVRN